MCVHTGLVESGTKTRIDVELREGDRERRERVDRKSSRIGRDKERARKER